MAFGERFTVYVSEKNESVLKKVDKLRPGGLSRAELIFNLFRGWLEEQEDEQPDAERS